MAVLLLFSLGVRAAAAGSPDHKIGNTVEHGGGMHLTVGAKGSYLAALDHGHTSHLGGGGIFAEVMVIPEWLEIELEVRIFSGHGTSLPIDLLFKKPFHLSSKTDFFLGVGPTVVPVFAPGGNTTHFGGAFVAGIYYWLTPHLGVVLEADYNLISSHGAVHELGSGVGFAYKL